jgi:hypothetical protein
MSEEIINSTSCSAKEPFIKLDENGSASILNYNIPQSTAYDAVSFVNLGIAATSFKEEIPHDTFWESIENLTLTEILLKLLDEVDRAANESLFENSNLLYLNGVIETGPKRLLDFLAVDSQVVASTPNAEATRSSAFRIVDQAATPLIPTDDFFGDNNTSPNGGNAGSSNNSSTNYTIGSYSSSLNVNTDAVPPANLLLQLGDLNLNNLANDIPSIHVLRLYKIAGIPIFEIAMKIKRGFKPVLVQDTFGDVHLEFLPEPTEITPKVELVLHFKMNNYLGDYGAGKTVKTFSLLPGEKTTISIRNWKRTEIIKKKAENILDSFSESSANDLQNIIEQASGSSSTSGSGKSKDKSKNFGASLDINVGAEIGLDFGLGSTTNSSLNSMIGNQVSNLANSTTKQSSKADALREIEVNVETSEITQNETEETVTRELQNINQSRVLNFVFRQLLQEYISITYLDKISLVFSNGTKTLLAELENLEGFMGALFEPTAIADIRNKLYIYLSNIKDYQGNSTSFIEKVEESIYPVVPIAGQAIVATTPDPADILDLSYIRKRQDLVSSYQGFTVKGIIQDVTNRTIRTDAVIADALLGQGEALDCYNIKLQNEAVREAILNNMVKEQAIAVIDGIVDPIQKAELYKKVNGACCDVAQSGCGCNETN